MKIKEMYMIFDKNNELKPQYFTTFGKAQCNLYGCICLENLIDSLKGLLKSYQDTEKEINLLTKEWEKEESKETMQNNIVNILLGYKIDRETKFTEKYKELYKYHNNLMNSYSNTIDLLLTADETKKIIKKNGYIVLNEIFIDKMVELLESKLESRYL